jgi:DNA-binding response OmpR family regulator
MKILVADDSPISRITVRRALASLGHEIVEACDGREALEAMCQPDGPHIAVLDWLMPELDGPEVCAALRARTFQVQPYLLLLTSKCSKDDLLEGLGHGADEFLIKPFLEDELRARIRVAERIVALEETLVQRVRELEDARGHLKALQEFIPICMYCHKIRHPNQDWQRLEEYLREHADMTLSHGLCPDCFDKVVKTLPS